MIAFAAMQKIAIYLHYCTIVVIIGLNLCLNSCSFSNMILGFRCDKFLATTYLHKEFDMNIYRVRAKG